MTSHGSQHGALLQRSPTVAAPSLAAASSVRHLPLISPAWPSRPLAWRASGPIGQQQFLHDVQALAVRLPPATYALNLCADRYHFMIAFAAACLRGQTNLLPPSQAAGVIDDIGAAYPGCYALRDTDPGDVRQPSISVTGGGDTGGHAAQKIPAVPADHIAALAFTSGSTGRPQAHAKTWRNLVLTARLAHQRFLGDGTAANIVATVPPQHMYGLETTVMMALAGGCAAHSGRAFFPADLCEALQQVPAPRVLITTPFHLRACVAARLPFPALHLIISATAPLELEAALAAEAALGAPVHEIYGCTEAGSMASRRIASTPIWQFYPGMRLTRLGCTDFVHGDHLDAPVALPDAVEDLGRGRFRLLGRSADMLKVAGKRASLGELTSRLLRIPGVRDAVMFVPEPAAGRELRPAALVAAPGLSEPQILSALEAMIDPVFLPRPLIRLQCLPRNAVGKLPRAVLLAALERSRA